MTIDVLIFDLDGTLLDTAPDITAALNHTLSVHNLGPVTLEETKASVGEGVARLIEKVLALKRAPSLDRKEFTQQYLDYYSSHLTVATAPYPEVAETLQRLDACPMAVITNKLTHLATAVLRAFDLLKFFEFIAGGDTTLEKKPSPAPILHVLKALKADPDRALMIGDSIFDIRAGRAAGLKTVAVTYGYGAPGFTNEADFVIDRFSQLVDVVRRLNNGDA